MRLVQMSIISAGRALGLTPSPWQRALFFLRRVGLWSRVGALATTLHLSCEGNVAGTLPGSSNAQSDPPGAVSAEPPVSLAEETSGSTGSASPARTEGAGGSGSTSQGASELSNRCSSAAPRCRAPVRSSEPLVGRSLPPVQALVTERVPVSAIWNAFARSCGRCHAPPRTPDASNGNWVVGSVEEFVLDPRVGAPAIDSLTTEDAAWVMPPGRDVTRPLSGRLRELLLHLESWQATGKSAEGYEHELDAEPHTPYRELEALAEEFTALGNCIPEPAVVACAERDMAEIDGVFARMRDGNDGGFADLPRRLRDTDLFTLDSAELAEHGVVAYAPTYTLFSDDAKKLRHVRTPLGQPIRYDAETRSLVIPDNTRFYKTFLRKIRNASGQEAYRKVETRIIVARETRDEGAPSRAVFGTYRWSLDESWAELVDDPYEDGTPFKDVLLRHITDEAAALALPTPLDPNTSGGIAAAFELDVAKRQDALARGLDISDQLLTRGYAIPGRDRCVQCHMGRSSFILGFDPYQVDRRRGSQGGVYAEPAAEDELSQLSRLLDYGVLEIDDKEVAPAAGGDARFRLEDSQGDRATSTGRFPRNELELRAQGYMMGNCAFCHNSRGFPSVENPSLRSVLDFYPRAAALGGVFEFPLDRFSPRTLQGEKFDTQFPYITPSLFARDAFAQESASTRMTLAGEAQSTQVFVVAPWRSLLYRNVQSPFTYSANEAIHPHMPMNVPGHDCKAQAILGEWMLSIPARLAEGAANDNLDATAQPWVEVPRDDPNFAAYVAAAERRVEAFGLQRIVKVSERLRGIGKPPSDAGDLDDVAGAPDRKAYLGGKRFCPDTSDVIAVEMQLPDARGRSRDSPLSDPLFVVDSSDEAPARLTRDLESVPVAERAQLGTVESGVPDRPHWVERDLTVPEGLWAPRRTDWQQAFSDKSVFVPAHEQLTHEQEAERQTQQVAIDNAERVFELLPEIKDDARARAFALADYPYGLWSGQERQQHALGEEERCESALRRAPRVASLAKESRPHWINHETPPTSLVYMQSPGAVMFDLICANCHGSDGDADSLLAGTILELTGGSTRVANLRDGLFGLSGDNRTDVFGDAETAARYLIWMGLGGTQLSIPSVVLNRVGRTQPLGVDRVVNPNAQATANMLDNAVGFCKDSLGGGDRFRVGVEFDLQGGFPAFDPSKDELESTLVGSNGDAELWVKMCAQNNPPPVRAIAFRPDVPSRNASFVVDGQYWPSVDKDSLFEASRWVGGPNRTVEMGLSEENWLPWCVRRPTEEADQERLETRWSQIRSEPRAQIPYCPSELFLRTDALELQRVAPLGEADERRDRWATRGAMNVGLAVFYYLDALSRGEVSRKPAYDACALGAP